MSFYNFFYKLDIYSQVNTMCEKGRKKDLDIIVPYPVPIYIYICDAWHKISDCNKRKPLLWLLQFADLSTRWSIKSEYVK